MSSERRKEIAKRRRQKAAAEGAAQLTAIDEDPAPTEPDRKIGGTTLPRRKTGPSVADLNPMEELMANRAEAEKQLQEVELMRRRMVARAEDIERRALDRKLSAARYAAAKEELEHAERAPREKTRPSFPAPLVETARTSEAYTSTARTDLDTARLGTEASFPVSVASSSEMARVGYQAARVGSPDAVPALNLFPHGSRFTKPSEEFKARARAAANLERDKRKPSESVKDKARKAAEARRNLEQPSLARPSVASDAAVHRGVHNEKQERRAAELARRAKLVREVERAQADVAATAERAANKVRKDPSDEFGEQAVHPEVAACRRMWAKPNDMDADSSSEEDETGALGRGRPGQVPKRPVPSVLKRRAKAREAKSHKRAAKKAELSAPADDKRALREYVQTATERASGGDVSKALNSATADVARARREAEALTQKARDLRTADSDSDSSAYSDGPGMDAALNQKRKDDLKKARREAQYADLEAKKALAKAKVQEEVERVRFLRRSIAEKNAADTKAQETEAQLADKKAQAGAPDRLKKLREKRRAPQAPPKPKKEVPTDEELLQGEVANFFLREPPREQLRFLKFALEPEQKNDLPAVSVAFKHANAPENVMVDQTFDNATLVEHICLDLEHQHVAYLRPYCLLLGVLIGRKPNLRKALLMGVVKTLNARMRGREKETFSKTPTLTAQSMDACRQLMVRLVWGRSQGQLRDSWNPEHLTTAEVVARAKRPPAAAPAPSVEKKAVVFVAGGAAPA